LKLEHCFKCAKQIEFRDKKRPNVTDDKKSEMNRLETHPNYVQSASVYEFWYCNGCWFQMGNILQMKGYLPRGLDGFAEEEKWG
jgi:hypothetical protein